MKNLLILVALFIFNIQTYCQDIIETRTGEKIEAKVVEITTTMIKYRRLDQEDGPIRNIAIKNVSQIIYADGTKDRFVLVEVEEPTYNKPKVDQNKPPARRGPDRIPENKDRLLEHGLFVDALIGYGYEEGYYGGQDYVGFGARFGHKFYFGKNEKYHAGIQATWLRLQVFTDQLQPYGSTTTGIVSPLGVAFANIIKLKEKQGLEINIGAAPLLLSFPEPSNFDFGLMYGMDIKYRNGRFAIGVDISRGERGFYDDINMFNLTCGFKF